MNLDHLPTGELQALAAELEDLRHDLGKYIRFETGFVGPDCETTTLRAALRADLLATSKERDGTAVSCWQLWERRRPQALEGDIDVATIDDLLAQLAVLDLEGPRPQLLEAARLARLVSDATRRLLSRVRQRQEPEEPDV